MEGASPPPQGMHQPSKCRAGDDNGKALRCIKLFIKRIKKSIAPRGDLHQPQKRE